MRSGGAAIRCPIRRIIRWWTVQRPGPLRRHLHRLGCEQQRLVGRGRDQVLYGRRCGLADDLRHGHRRLLRRGLGFRASAGAVWRVLVALLWPAAGDSTGWTLSQPAAIRHVPLAHYGPDPLPAGSARDDSGAGLARLDAGICRFRTTSPRPSSGIRPSRTALSRRCRPTKGWRLFDRSDQVQTGNVLEQKE